MFYYHHLIKFNNIKIYKRHANNDENSVSFIFSFNPIYDFVLYFVTAFILVLFFQLIVRLSPLSNY